MDDRNHHAHRPMQEGADQEMIERLVEARLTERLEAESFHWRLRLIAIETVIMGLLVLAAGCVLKQPIMMVMRASLLVAGSCLVTGLLLVGMSAIASKMVHRLGGSKAR